MGMKLFTTGSISSSLSIPSNQQVSEYNLFCYYIHVLNCIIGMVVLCILQLFYFNDDNMLLTILCNFYIYCAYHIYIFILIYEADITAVGYVCLCEGTSSGSKFLQCSTHVTTWLEGQVKFHYQDSMTSRWKMSKITTDVIMQQFKSFIESIPVPIRIYVYIMRYSLFFTNGIGPWQTPVP